MKRFFVLLSVCFLSSNAAALPAPTVVATFDADALEAPEGLWINAQNDVYITMGLTGEVREVDSTGAQSTFATLPLGAPPLTECFGFVPALTGIDRDPSGDWYLALRSCTPGQTGIYRLDRDGTGQELIAQMPDGVLPNGLVVVGDSVYVTESFTGTVWKAPTAGGSASIWCADPLLQPWAGSGLPGANGLKEFGGDLVVASSDKGLIVEIPINQDGSSGTPFLRAVTSPVGCDDFSFDVEGTLYCGTDMSNLLLSVDATGGYSTVYTAADGLDGPTATLFGRGSENTTLYILNAALPFFSTTHMPSLMKVDVGVRGDKTFP